MKLKKIISLVCLFSLFFTNFIFLNAFAANCKDRVIFLGDVISLKPNRISSRIRQRNRNNVWEVLDKDLFTKFNIGNKKYIDFNKLAYDRIDRGKKREILRNVGTVVVVVSYLEYNIQNVVSRYVSDIDMDNVPVMLVGYTSGDNNGRGEEYKHSVNDAARSCGIEDNVFFVDFMTGNGIEDVELNIELLCLNGEEVEGDQASHENPEVHPIPVVAEPNADNAGVENSAGGQLLANSGHNFNHNDDEKCDAGHQDLDYVSSIKISSHSEGKSVQKVLTNEEKSKSDEKNKIDWMSVLNVGTLGTGISSLAMVLFKKIISSKNMDKFSDK